MRYDRSHPLLFAEENHTWIRKSKDHILFWGEATSKLDLTPAVWQVLRFLNSWLEFAPLLSRGVAASRMFCIHDRFPSEIIALAWRETENLEVSGLSAVLPGSPNFPVMAW